MTWILTGAQTPEYWTDKSYNPSNQSGILDHTHSEERDSDVTPQYHLSAAKKRDWCGSVQTNVGPILLHDETVILPFSEYG